MSFGFRRSMMLGCASALVLMSPAFAQTANNADGDDEEDLIIVRGFRKAVESSVLSKRNSDIVAEVVTAEDIGRLPDISIADALGRLPEVTVQRTGGQASALNIRGLN